MTMNMTTKTKSNLTRGVALAALIVAAACAGGCSESKTNTTPEAGVGPFVLATGFDSEVRIDSTVGEATRAACAGFFPAQPSYLMTLQNTFTGLSVSVTGNAPLALTIVFGASTFCGQDTPVTVSRGSWSMGEYQIYVGTTMQNAPANYTLTATE